MQQRDEEVADCEKLARAARGRLEQPRLVPASCSCSPMLSSASRSSSLRARRSPTCSPREDFLRAARAAVSCSCNMSMEILTAQRDVRDHEDGGRDHGVVLLMIAAASHHAGSRASPAVNARVARKIKENHDLLLAVPQQLRVPGGERSRDRSDGCEEDEEEVAAGDDAQRGGTRCASGMARPLPQTIYLPVRREANLFLAGICAPRRGGRRRRGLPRARRGRSRKTLAPPSSSIFGFSASSSDAPGTSTRRRPRRRGRSRRRRHLCRVARDALRRKSVGRHHAGALFVGDGADTAHSPLRRRAPPSRGTSSSSDQPVVIRGIDLRARRAYSSPPLGTPASGPRDSHRRGDRDALGLGLLRRGTSTWGCSFCVYARAVLTTLPRATGGRPPSAPPGAREGDSAVAAGRKGRRGRRWPLEDGGDAALDPRNFCCELARRPRAAGGSAARGGAARRRAAAATVKDGAGRGLDERRRVGGAARGRCRLGREAVSCRLQIVDGARRRRSAPDLRDANGLEAARGVAAAASRDARRRARTASPRCPASSRRCCARARARRRPRCRTAARPLRRLVVPRG